MKSTDLSYDLLNIEIENGKKKIAIKIPYPKKCPLCKEYQKPMVEKAVMLKEFDYQVLYVVYRCSSCEKTFVAKYIVNSPITFYNSLNDITVCFSDCYPNVFDFSFSFGKCEDISPNFCLIAKEALKCKMEKMDRAAGITLRLAVEYLINKLLRK